jgi:hypothetical protein
VSALLVGLEIGRFTARVMAAKYFQHGGKAENTEFTEARGGPGAAVHEQRVMRIDASAHAARSAILFLRDLQVLRSFSVLKVLSRQFVEDRARHAHKLPSRSRASSSRALA